MVLKIIFGQLLILSDYLLPNEPLDDRFSVPLQEILFLKQLLFRPLQLAYIINLNEAVQVLLYLAPMLINVQRFQSCQGFALLQAVFSPKKRKESRAWNLAVSALDRIQPVFVHGQQLAGEFKSL